MMCRLFVQALLTFFMAAVHVQSQSQTAQVGADGSVTNAPAIPAGTIALPPDMGCLEGPRKEAWASVKKRFRTLFDGSTSPFEPVPTEAMALAIQAAIADVNAVGGLTAAAAGECGFGKLFIQLMSLATVEDPNGLVQYISDHPTMSSPVMTMLIDIPWVLMAQSGWPFFGILAQVSFQKNKVLDGLLKTDAVDGLMDDVSKGYFEQVQQAKGKGDLVAMAQASVQFLNHPKVGEGSTFGTLCAMATQAAMQMDVKDRLATLEILQKSFRNVMKTPAELELALSARWPLWGFLHIGVDVFADV